MARSNLKLVTPAYVKGTVAPPRRKPNAELRSREHLTEAEIERLMKAAGYRCRLCESIPAPMPGSNSCLPAAV